MSAIGMFSRNELSIVRGLKPINIVFGFFAKLFADTEKI